MDIIERIQNLRDEMGLSNRDVERGAGIASSSISQWRRGNGKPCLENIIRLSEFFGVSTDYLLGLSDCRKRVMSGSVLSLSEEETQILALYRRFDTINKFRMIRFCMDLSGDGMRNS